MSCLCDVYCHDVYEGHVCQLEPGHDGPHSCHPRLETKIKKGDIVWQDGLLSPPHKNLVIKDEEEFQQMVLKAIKEAKRRGRS